VQGEVVIELGEVWRFLCSKKTWFGSGRRFVELLGSLLIGGAEIEVLKC
jgi:hypothetical protein